MKNIHNTYNYNKININNNFPRIVGDLLSEPANFSELLFIIDRYILRNKINKLTSTYTKTIVCNNCNSKIDSNFIVATHEAKYPVSIAGLLTSSTKI